MDLQMLNETIRLGQRVPGVGLGCPRACPGDPGRVGARVFTTQRKHMGSYNIGFEIPHHQTIGKTSTFGVLWDPMWVPWGPMGNPWGPWALKFLKFLPPLGPVAQGILIEIAVPMGGGRAPWGPTAPHGPLGDVDSDSNPHLPQGRFCQASGVLGGPVLCSRLRGGGRRKGFRCCSAAARNTACMV